MEIRILIKFAASTGEVKRVTLAGKIQSNENDFRLFEDFFSWKLIEAFDYLQKQFLLSSLTRAFQAFINNPKCGISFQRSSKVFPKNFHHESCEIFPRNFISSHASRRATQAEIGKCLKREKSKEKSELVWGEEKLLNDLLRNSD